jgi:hypothetical protein
MKKFISSIVLLVSGFTWAQDTFTVRTDVLVRDARFRPRIARTELPYLLGRDRLEGKYFKIVEGKSEEAIRLSANPELLLRAATTYYHLNKARDWFVQNLGASYVRDLPTLTIRVNHTNQFHELGHFAHDNLEPQYNNALTIPAGTGLAGRGIHPWGTEIWFRPEKRMHIDELGLRDPSLGTWGGVLSSYRQQQHMSTLQRFLMQGVEAGLDPDSPAVENFFTWGSVIRVAGSSLVMELAYRNADRLNRTFSQKWYWMDTALVPEIIYHEFAHVALADHLSLTHPNSVVEGMADYFAGAISGNPRLAEHIHDHNSFNGKNAQRTQTYQAEFETTEYANTDFVFGMLWDLRDFFGAPGADQFIYQLRERLNSSATIRRQLIDGILQTCERRCVNPFADKVRILQRYTERGL